MPGAAVHQEIQADRDAYGAGHDLTVNNYSGMSSVPVAVAAKNPAAVFAAVGMKSFTGREWLAADIDRFIAASPCGYAFVEADAGLGKTAFAAWLVKSRRYPSHFSRYPGGRTLRAALQNLSAQLIMDYGLTDMAPGAMVPGWATSTDGFEALLGAAAATASARGQRVIIVIDGLDEAEQTGDGLSFGLPALLPSGVYVIATYRTGHWPGRPECPTLRLSIKRDDERNTQDIRTYLSRAVTEDPLAARLASAGADPATFARLLAERCGGVWVYLRYALEDLRLGLRHPAVGRRCDLTFRPVLNAIASTTGTSRRYEIYHASLREVLNGVA